MPDLRCESGERQDRGHAEQPYGAEHAGQRDQPGFVGREPRGAQQPLEHGRARYLDGLTRAVPHRSKIHGGGWRPR